MAVYIADWHNLIRYANDSPYSDIENVGISSSVSSSSIKAVLRLLLIHYRQSTSSEHVWYAEW